ncbi:MAG: hypothetical protein D6767_07830, partial [Candidatus Hydrogenedentota bacterium]
MVYKYLHLFSINFPGLQTNYFLPLFLVLNLFLFHAKSANSSIFFIKSQATSTSTRNFYYGSKKEQSQWKSINDSASTKSKDNEVKASRHYKLGKQYITKGEYPLAIEHLEKASNYFNNEENLASTYLYLGKAYMLNINPASAIKNFLKAYELYQSEGNVIGKFATLVETAECFRKFSRYKEADSTLKQAIILQSTSVIPLDLIFGLYSRISAVANETGNIDKAMIFSKMALKIASRLKNPIYKAVSLNEIANIKQKKGDISAIDDYLYAAYLRKKTKQMRDMASVYSNIANWYYLQGQYNTSQKYLDTLAHISQNKSWPVIELELDGFRAANYRALGDYKKALHFQDKHYQHLIEYLNKTHKIELEKANFNYFINKKELIIQNQKELIARDKQLLDIRNKQRLIFLIAFLIFLILFSIVLYLF